MRPYLQKPFSFVPSATRNLQGLRAMSGGPFRPNCSEAHAAYGIPQSAAALGPVTLIGAAIQPRGSPVNELEAVRLLQLSQVSHAGKTPSKALLNDRPHQPVRWRGLRIRSRPSWSGLKTRVGRKGRRCPLSAGRRW